MLPLTLRRDPITAQLPKQLEQWTSNSMELPWEFIKPSRHPKNRETAVGSPEHCSDSGKDPLLQQRWKKQFCVLCPALTYASKYQPMRQELILFFINILSQVLVLCQHKCLMHKRKGMMNTIFVAWHLYGHRESVCIYLASSMQGTVLDTIGNKISPCPCGVYV